MVSFMPVVALPMDAVVFSIEGSPLSPALIGPVGAGERCGHPRLRSLHPRERAERPEGF